MSNRDEFVVSLRDLFERDLMKAQGSDKGTFDRCPAVKYIVVVGWPNVQCGVTSTCQVLMY